MNETDSVISRKYPDRVKMNRSIILMQALLMMMPV